MATQITSPRIVAVAKPPGGVGKAVAKPAVAKPAVAKAVAKLPASLTVSSEIIAPLASSGETSAPLAKSDELAPEVTGQRPRSGELAPVVIAARPRSGTFPAANPDPSLPSPRVTTATGLARPVGITAKAAPNFAPKPAPINGLKPSPPSATPMNVSTSPGTQLKKVPAAASSKSGWNPQQFGSPAKKSPSINTIRNKWEHTTSNAGGSFNEAKITMCEKKNLHALLKLHRCNNVRVTSLTKEVIENLVELPTGELCMEMKNGFRPLVDLTKFNEDDIQVWALWSLAHLAAHSPCQVAIIMEVGWHNIKTRYAASPLEEVKQATCLLLANLSHSQKNQAGIIEKGVPILMTFLRFHDSNTLPWALRALADITRIKDHGAKEIWDNELLSIIIPYVLDDTNPELQLPALQILSNICADDSLPITQKVLSAGVVDMLVNLMEADDMELAGNAAMVCAHLAKRDIGASAIKSAGGHSSLIRIVDCNNQFVQLGVVHAINNMADFPEIAYVLKKDDAVEPLTEVILSTPIAAIEHLALQALEKLDKEALKYVEQKLIEKSRPGTPSSAVAKPSVRDFEEDSKRKALEEQKRRDEEQRKKEQEAERKRQLELQKNEEAEAKKRLADLELYNSEKKAELEAAKRAADAQRLEEKRIAEERERKAADERRAAEEKRAAEDRERRAADERRAAEDKRLAEEKQKLEDEKRRKLEQEEEEKKRKELKEKYAAAKNESNLLKEEDERRKMRERLEKEEKIELARLEALRANDEEKRKIEEQRRKLAEDKMRLELLQTQREEEDRLRAQKEAVERELEEKKKLLAAAQIEEERRKGEQRLQEELARLERQRQELEFEKKRHADSRQRDSTEERRLMDERLSLERELLEKSKRALEEEKRLMEKLQRDREEEEKLRAERLKVEHSIEMQKLLADKSRLAQERQQMEDDLQAEKAKLERHKAEMLEDIERRRKEEQDRLAREKEFDNLMKNSSGAIYADEIRAMEERIRADREALEAERKGMYAMKEDKFALERERDNLERLRRQYEEERRQKEEEDEIRRSQQMKEIQSLRKRVEEDMEKAEEEKKKFHESEKEWEQKLEAERLKIERDSKRLLEDGKAQNLSAEDEHRIAEEKIRLEEEKAKFAADREAFENMRRRELDNEEKGDEFRTQELERLIKMEEDARQKAEAERKLLEEVKEKIALENQKAAEHQEAISELLEYDDENMDADEIRKSAAKLKKELAKVERERMQMEREREELEALEKRIEEEAEKRIQKERQVVDKENQIINSQLIAKESELGFRERKLRDAEADVMRMMVKLEKSYGDDESPAVTRRRRSDSSDSSRSRSRSRSRTPDDSSITSRGRERRRRSLTPNGLRKNRSRSRDSRSPSLAATSTGGYSDTERNSSDDRYTDTYVDDTETRTEFISDDDDDYTQTDDSFYANKKKSKGSTRSTPKAATPKRHFESESDYTETGSQYSRASDDEKDLKRSRPDLLKSPRTLNYVDTPDGFDGGGDMGETDDDDESIEGLADSDPHKAARELMKLLEQDQTRKLREPSLDSLQKFAMIRGGEPTQLEAREIIPVLMNVLNVYPDKSHQNIISITLLILAILAYNKEINQLYIRRENGGQTLMDLLDFPINTIKARAALALAGYSLNNGLIKRECAPAIVKLLAILKENAADEQIKMSVCAALASLSDENKDNQRKILKKQGLKLLLHLTSSNQIPPKYALNLIAALAHKNKDIQNQIRKDYEGIFRKMVRLLSPYTKPKILESAIHALVELVRNNATNKHQVSKAGAVPFLITILLSKNNQNPEIVAGALYLCWACSKKMPNKLDNAEFRNPKGGLDGVIEPLREMQNEHVQKIIGHIDAKLAKRRQRTSPRPA